MKEERIRLISFVRNDERLRVDYRCWRRGDASLRFSHRICPCLMSENQVHSDVFCQINDPEKIFSSSAIEDCLTYIIAFFLLSLAGQKLLLVVLRESSCSTTLKKQRLCHESLSFLKRKERMSAPIVISNRQC